MNCNAGFRIKESKTTFSVDQLLHSAFLTEKKIELNISQHVVSFSTKMPVTTFAIDCKVITQHVEEYTYNNGVYTFFDDGIEKPIGWDVLRRL